MPNKERRKIHSLTESEIDNIAQRAANATADKFRREVFDFIGRSVLDKLIYLVGLLTVAIILWLSSKDLI